MRSPTILYAVLLASNLSYAGSVLAEETNLLPAPQTQNGISYISGGIGSDQVTAMKGAASDYSLMLTCALQPSGQYLADIQIAIADASGTVILATVADGPILLASLKPGTYRIDADYRGAKQNKTVQIGASQTTKVNISWPDPVTDDHTPTLQSAPSERVN